MSDSFALEKQKLLFECVISSSDLFATCNPIIKTQYFDPSLRHAVNFAQEYFDKYKSIPSPAQVKAETGIELVRHELQKAESKYVADEIETFCRNKAVEAAILSAPALLEKQDMGKIIDQLKDAISVGLTKDLGTDYFDNPTLRLQALLDNNIVIPTGWTDVDEVLQGGVSRQELLMFMANSGVGKSVAMLNLAVNLMKQKLNGIYITLELAERVVSKRLDSMLTGIPQHEILRNIDVVSAKLANINNDYGRLFIKRMAESTTNANHIRAYVKEFQQTHGYLPDFIVIDYLDLMTTNHKIPQDNLFIKDKFVAEECRALGFEFDALIISASQMGRSALEAESINQGHIQGGISKVNTADNLIAIIQSEQMKAAGEYVFEFAKTRNSNGVGKNVLLAWDPISLRISNIGGEGGLKFNKKNSGPVTQPGFVMPSADPAFNKNPSATKSASDLLNLMRT